MEAFYTIQGEGKYTGFASYFIRLGGCDVGCHWCDVKESWDADAHEKISVKNLLDGCLNTPTKIAVITGGEPLIHNLDELTTALQINRIRTHIETSGSSPLSGFWDWICLSPKKFKEPLQQVCNVANELKVVIFNNSDFAWAELYAEKVNDLCKLYLQPEWGKAENLLPEIISYIQENPKWQLSLQIHKFIGVR